THFAGVGAALFTAPKGAVIAIDTGTYVETFAPLHAMTLVGRCAAKVIVESPDAAGIGLDVYNVEGVTARGMTFRGHAFGVDVENGSLTLVDSVIEQSHGPNIAVSGSGTHVSITGTVVRGAVSSAMYTATGVDVRDGGHVDISKSVVAANAFMNIFVGD